LKKSIVFLLLCLVLLSISTNTLPATAGAPDQPPANLETNNNPVLLPASLSNDEWQDIREQVRSDIYQEAYIKASNTNAGDYFGWDLAISGDTMVVGAFVEASNATGVNGDQTNNTIPNAGAAYVFVRSGSSWVQQAYLKASNTGVDRFGYAVAISGNTIVVGAHNESSNATGVNGDQNNNSATASGAAYVFMREGSTWSQQAYLKSSNSQTGDNFGYSVAVSGDTIVVGAKYEDSNATGVNGDQGNNSIEESGAAYVFHRDGSTWSQQAYLKASNPDIRDYFGESVAISGDTVVVGASEEDSDATGVNGDQTNNAAPYAGAAYVFVRNGTNWAQQAYLKASNTEFARGFSNHAVAISGDTIVIGAYGEGSNATGVNGDQNNNLALASGAAYVFTRSDSTWSQQAYLKASNTWPSYRFGYGVDISGNKIVVGSPYEASNAIGVNGDQGNKTALDSGAVYEFVRLGSTWVQQAYIKASNTDPGDFFGYSAAISENTIVVGASNEDSNATGIDGNQSDDSMAIAGAVYAIYDGTILDNSVYGYVKNDLGNPMANVEVTLNNGLKATTDAQGLYRIMVDEFVPYTVTPSLPGFRFAPEQGAINWAKTNQQDFIIRPAVPVKFLDLPFSSITYPGFTVSESFAITASGNVDKTGEKGKVNSWFDHQYPTYTSSPNAGTNNIRLWNGRLHDFSTETSQQGVSYYDGHDGIDFSLKYENVLAVAEGEVDANNTGWGCLGYYVTIDHNNGYFSVYGHLRDKPTVAGHVDKGDIIGISGNTYSYPCSSSGPHLHFAIFYDVNGNGKKDALDKAVDPFGWDPFYAPGEDPWSVAVDSFYLWNYSNNFVCTITSAASTQTSPTGFLTMQIPTGAVTSEMILEIIDTPPIASPFSNYYFTGQSFFTRFIAIPPEGAPAAPARDEGDFINPVDMVVKYDPVVLPHFDLTNLVLYEWDEVLTSWTALPSTIDPVALTVTAPTTHLGSFSLQAPLVCANAVYEPNDNYDAATYLPGDNMVIGENFDIETDEDWFKLDALAGQKFKLDVSHLAPGVALTISVVDHNGSTVLASHDTSGMIEFRAPSSGTYFVHITRSPEGAYGCDAAYDISLQAQPLEFFLPMIMASH